MSTLRLADHIREAAWTHGNALRKPEVALAVARAFEPDPEVSGVAIGDGEDLRHEKDWVVDDGGTRRELRLRLARGVIRDMARPPEEAHG